MFAYSAVVCGHPRRVNENQSSKLKDEQDIWDCGAYEDGAWGILVHTRR